MLKGLGCTSLGEPCAGETIAEALFIAGGGGRSINRGTPGFTNIPLFGGQLKYRSPCTEPSFLPSGPSNSIPIHSPGAKRVSPT